MEGWLDYRRGVSLSSVFFFCIGQVSPSGFDSSGSAASTSAATTVSSAPTKRSDGGSPSLKIMTQLEEVVPSLKRRHLVRQNAADPSTKAPVEEPVFRITEIIEPSSSEVVSSDPPANDQVATLALGSVTNLGEGEDAAVDGVHARAAIPECHVMENPQSNTSYPQLKEDMMDTYFALLGSSPINLYQSMGDIRLYTRFFQDFISVNSTNKEERTFSVVKRL